MDDLLLASSGENAFELGLLIDKQDTCPYLHGSIPLHLWAQQYTHSLLSVLSFPYINYTTNLTQSTTTQLTSHMPKFPLTHEISHGSRIILFHTSYKGTLWIFPILTASFDGSIRLVCYIGCALLPDPSAVSLAIDDYLSTTLFWRKRGVDLNHWELCAAGRIYLWVQDPGTYSSPRGWLAITSDSGFMRSSCRPQSELGPTL